MAKKPKKEAEAVQGLPCRQCHNTGGCIRGGKCEKGFTKKPKE